MKTYLVIILIFLITTSAIIWKQDVIKTHEKLKRIEQKLDKVLKNQTQLYKLFTPVMPEHMNPQDLTIPKRKQ